MHAFQAFVDWTLRNRRYFIWADVACGVVVLFCACRVAYFKWQLIRLKRRKVSFAEYRQGYWESRMEADMPVTEPVAEQPQFVQQYYSATRQETFYCYPDTPLFRLNDWLRKNPDAVRCGTAIFHSGMLTPEGGVLPSTASGSPVPPAVDVAGQLGLGRSPEPGTDPEGPDGTGGH